MVGHDVRDGHKVSDVKLLGLTGLIGSDAANQPVVVVHLGGFDQGRGPFSLPVWTGDGRWLFLLLTTVLAAWREGLSAPVITQLDGRPSESLAVGVFAN